MAQFVWPPITSANPSIGGNGATAPTSSTEVGGIGLDGNLHALSTTNTGVLNVNVSSTTTTPLPVTDAAAEVSLASIDTKTPGLGQALAAGSTPVVLTAAQVATLTPLTTVTVTQATGTNLHTVVDSGSITATQATASALNVTDATGTAIQGTVAAGTAATKSALVGQVYSSTVPVLTNGQQVAAQSDVNGNHLVISPDLYFIGQSAQTATINNIIPATASANATDTLGYHSAAVQLICPAATFTTGAVTFEGSNDNVNFQTIPVYSQLILTGTPIVAAITLVTTTSLVYTFPIQTRYIRVRISTGITGASAQVQAFTKLSVAAWSPGLTQVAQATAANLNATVAGTVTANQGTAAVIANSWYAKISDATTGPVKVQAASTAPAAADIALTVALSPNGVTPKSSGRALANAPTVTTYGTPVTSAAYVTIIASTTSATNLVEVFDSSGVALFFATGAAASEVNQFVIYPGGNGQVPLSIPAGTRISYKAVSTSATGASAFNVLNLYT